MIKRSVESGCGGDEVVCTEDEDLRVHLQETDMERESIMRSTVLQAKLARRSFEISHLQAC